MPTIVISDSSTTLSVDQTHFTLRSNGRKIGRIPPGIIDQVVVFHGVDVARSALSRLGSMGIPVTFLDRESRVESRLVPAWKFNALPRLGQAKAFFDPSQRLLLARRFVHAKLCNAAAILQQHAGNHPETNLGSIASQIRQFAASLPNAMTIAEIMGIEGIAGKQYFSGLSRMIRVEWTEFRGRNRQPPLDPVNAVLSYAYAVLAHQLMAYLESVGLDPYIGFLHSIELRRPVLALDMMEPFRPVLGDRLMLRLLNLGTLRQEHFEESRGSGHGIFINYPGRMALLQVFAEWSQSCDEALGEGFHAPGYWLLKEAERFEKLARHHTLEQFVPYYLQPRDAEQCPK